MSPWLDNPLQVMLAPGSHPARAAASAALGHDVSEAPETSTQPWIPDSEMQTWVAAEQSVPEPPQGNIPVHGPAFAVLSHEMTGPLASLLEQSNRKRTAAMRVTSENRVTGTSSPGG